jgi:hypothetical protein
MDGLIKIALDWSNDPKHQALSDEADDKWNDHRQIQRKVKLKEKKNERKFTGVAGLAGSTIGGMLGKKTPQSKAIGAALGGMFGAGIGYGLADLSFEHFNKDLVGQEAVAKRDYDRAQHRLFNYEEKQGENT